MLIRLANDNLVEYPDELGALVLADPGFGDVPDYTLEDLNYLISFSLAILWDDSLTLAQNIAKASEDCSHWAQPSAANMEKARAMIQFYKDNVAEKDIGYSSPMYINSLLDNQATAKRQTRIVEDVVSPVTNPPQLTAVCAKK
ncbi:hypothetical protein V8J88_11495 [Massilia sp. W12]|uniref:hypothetical protein n=1 Tax=Massilia sp. W12 TaxID=3126507 RepID=UPI0030CF34CA